jgi:hypothetical protein
VGRLLSAATRALLDGGATDLGEHCPKDFAAVHPTRAKARGGKG